MDPATIELNFGDVYYHQKYLNSRGEFSPHFLVILLEDQQTKNVYYQALSSRMFKLFKHWGYLSDDCVTCNTNPKHGEYFEFKLKGTKCLDLDTVLILNIDKYGFLDRDTFVCPQKVDGGTIQSVSNITVFKEEIARKKCSYKGTLNIPNKESLITAIKASNLNSQQIINAVKSYSGI